MSRSGSYGEEKNLLIRLEIEPRLLGRPVYVPYAIPTELSRLEYRLHLMTLHRV
jgi:hypothetical protein